LGKVEFSDTLYGLSYLKMRGYGYFMRLDRL
jgi:hypothetical protein